MKGGKAAKEGGRGMSESAKRGEAFHPRAGEATSASVPTAGEKGPGSGSVEASAPGAGGVGPPSGPPRLRTADRQQLLPPMPLDQVIEPDHPARAVWRFVEGLDLSLLYDSIRSRGDTPGRPACYPRIFVAL